jgi:hypothetical protein
MVRLFTLSPALQASIFFELPPELCQLIYRLLLVSYLQIPIEYNRLPFSRFKPQPIKSLIPAGSAALPMVCQDIYIEAEAILYISNRFAFLFTSNELLLFLISISLHVYKSVSDLDLYWLVNVNMSRKQLTY